MSANKEKKLTKKADGFCKSLTWNDWGKTRGIFKDCEHNFPQLKAPHNPPFNIHTHTHTEGSTHSTPQG